MIELLRARRSIRKYADRPLEPQKLELLKEAVLRSPSSRNIDPYYYLFESCFLAQISHAGILLSCCRVTL
jgi:nitroreductase